MCSATGYCKQAAWEPQPARGCKRSSYHLGHQTAIGVSYAISYRCHFWFTAGVYIAVGVASTITLVAVGILNPTKVVGRAVVDCAALQGQQQQQAELSTCRLTLLLRPNSVTDDVCVVLDTCMTSAHCNVLL